MVWEGGAIDSPNAPPVYELHGEGVPRMEVATGREVQRVLKKGVALSQPFNDPIHRGTDPLGPGVYVGVGGL